MKKTGSMVVAYSNGLVLAAGVVTAIRKGPKGQGNMYDVLDMKSRKHEEVFGDETVGWRRFGELLAEDMKAPRSGETYLQAWKTYWEGK